MPFTLDALEADTYARIIVRGIAKSGKSTTCIVTSPTPVFVVNCDENSALEGARRLAPNKRQISVENVRSWDQMKLAVKAADAAVKRGAKTVIVDPFTNFASRFEDALIDQYPNNTLNTYRDYGKGIRWLVNQFLRLQAHLIFTMHYGKRGEGADEQEEPLLAGQMRGWVPSQFSDILTLRLYKNERSFLTYGGCRSADMPAEIPADISKFLSTIRHGRGGEKKVTSTLNSNNNRHQPQR